MREQSLQSTSHQQNAEAQTNISTSELDEIKFSVLEKNGKAIISYCESAEKLDSRIFAMWKMWNVIVWVSFGKDLTEFLKM